MKAWYINLERSTDRRAHMERELSALGLEFERVDAVDGRALSDANVDSIYTQPPGEHFLDRGSIGVFLSQRKAWQAIVDSGDTHGIVFEDDILFGQNAKEILTDLSWLPDEIDLLRLETFRRHTVHDKAPIASVYGRDIVQLHHVHLGAGAYLISARAAKHLLDITRHFSYTCDYVMFDPACRDYCGLIVHQMVPALCVQSAVANQGGLDSILNDMRKASFARGPKRLAQKIVRELSKRKLLTIGLVTDRIKGRKTGKIEFK